MTRSKGSVTALGQVKMLLISDKEPELFMCMQESETKLAKDRQKSLDKDRGASRNWFQSSGLL